jgi:hypothetical protein
VLGLLTLAQVEELLSADGAPTTLEKAG